MGRHSRRGAAPQGSERARRADGAEAAASAEAAERSAVGRRRRMAAPAPRVAETHHQGAGPESHAVRGGHPEERSAGGYGTKEYGRGGSRYGDWQPAPRDGGATGRPRDGGAAEGGPAGQGFGGRRPSGQGAPGPRPGGPGGGARNPGPRHEYLAAFDAGPAARGFGGPTGAVPAPGSEAGIAAGGPPGPQDPVAGAKDGASGSGGGLARTLTGIAAGAVTTVLAIVVAGQVTGAGPDGPSSRAAGVSAAPGLADSGATGENGKGEAEGSRKGPGGPDARSGRTDRSEGRAVAPPTYAQLMVRQFPLDPKLKGPGEFEAVPGLDKAPGKGRKIRYRIDIEKGLGLDAGLFARAAQETLNDKRSWAHGGAMTFERISSGRPDFVLTLASPGTTAFWCAKSELDITEQNVSCDSARTDRVMINAYRWAQGSKTYGPAAMLPYRQMLINHEVGHRLGHGHVNCSTEGSLAPVMQQQTKSLDIGGVKCRANPWVFPNG
ncbi:DUF3152 domain-containing protein [Streptomyces sp. NPDC046887]|uniref:DUF3152 domain-containing protein n=1 Tax=Streptomyces sp. NPDC046887 TaxID=3155472 RepID=UPI003406EE10